MLRYSESSLDRYERILWGEVRVDIESSRNFLGEMGSRNDWTAPEMIRIRADISNARNRLRNNISMTERLNTALRNTRSVFMERMRVRREAITAFPNSDNNQSGAVNLLGKATRIVAPIARPIIPIPPIPPWINVIGDRITGIIRR